MEPINRANLSPRIGGLARQAWGNSNAIAAHARSGFDERFRKQALAIDPNLSGTDLESKVGILRSLYFTRLAKKSAEARARRRAR